MSQHEQFEWIARCIIAGAIIGYVIVQAYVFCGLARQRKERGR